MLLCCTAAPAHAGTAVVDRILATVNGDIITLSEFERFKTMLFFGAEEKPSGREAERQLLESLIERKLIVQEGRRLEIEVRDKEVDEALQDIIKRNNLTAARLEEELGRQGLTLAQYRGLLRDEIMQSHVIGRQVHAKIAITEQDIKNYQGRSPQKQGPRVRIQQILLLLPQDGTTKKAAELERTAAAIREKILAGESFEKLAAAHSQGAGAQQGGDLGYFYQGDLLPEIEQAAFSLEPGQVSPVIKTSLGLHLIKVTDRDSGGDNATGEQQAKEIRAMLYGMEFEKKMQDYIKSLREKACIEIN